MAMAVGEVAAGSSARGSPPGAGPLAGPISIRAVRTGPAEIGVVGTGDAGQPIDVIVNDVVVANSMVYPTGEYWFLHVPSMDNATVRTRIGTMESSPVIAPPYVPRNVGPPGFVYANGTRLMRDGSPIALFGADDTTAFPFALQAFAYNDTPLWGRNQLFPSGPDARIPGVATPNDFWREYFRYFLHYRQTGDPNNPGLHMLRIWILDLTWGTFAYDLWATRPAVVYQVFDNMTYWAGRAGVYLVPVIGQNSRPPDNTYYNRSSANYARHVALARALLQRYDASPQIAMWDLWNEADVGSDAYWATVGGINGYRAWVAGLAGDLRSSSANHLFTVGSAQSSTMSGVPTPFGWRKHFLYSDIPGLDVADEHTFAGPENQTAIDWRADWAAALGIPYSIGVYGYNGQRIHPLGYGYWPWFTRQWRAKDIGPLSSMVLVDNGKGPYADYPYLGALPAYPPENGTPNAPPAAAFVYAPSRPQAGSGVQFDASATTDDRGIVLYTWDFGDGGNGYGLRVAHAYVVAGAYTVSLRVEDTDVAIGSERSTVLVDPATVPDTTPPAVGITAPTNGTIVAGDVQVSAWATDDVSVASVTLYADQVLVGVAVSPPYGWTWPTSSVADGVHRLRAVANDTSGNLGEATSEVVVRNAPRLAPRVSSATWVAERSWVEIAFSMPMNRTSVEANLQTDPPAAFSIRWGNDSRLFVVLTGPPENGRTYTVTIGPGATDLQGTPMAAPFRYEFLPAPESVPQFPWGQLTLFLVAGVLVILALLLGARRRGEARRARGRPQVLPRTVTESPQVAFGGVEPETETVVHDGVAEVPLSVEGVPEASGPATPSPVPAARAEGELPKLLRWLDGIGAQIAKWAGGIAGSASRDDERDEEPPPSPILSVDRVPLGTTKGRVPKAGAWTELRARGAIEKFLKNHPWAPTAEIAEALGMDLRLARRVTASLRDERPR